MYRFAPWVNAIETMDLQILEIFMGWYWQAQQAEEHAIAKPMRPPTSSFAIYLHRIIASLDIHSSTWQRQAHWHDCMVNPTKLTLSWEKVPCHLQGPLSRPCPHSQVPPPPRLIPFIAFGYDPLRFSIAIGLHSTSEGMGESTPMPWMLAKSPPSSKGKQIPKLA